jgi:hypothetical protein
MARVAVVALAAWCALGGSTARAGLITHEAEAGTQAALEAALEARGVADEADVWLGKLDSVAGGARDVLIAMPRALDRARPIEVIVYLEGFGSFSARAIDERHAAAVARLIGDRRNAVYVAPDAPGSVHGRNQRAPGPYWRSGCGRGGGCRGGVSAPGDFIELLADVIARVEAVTALEQGGDGAAPPIDLRLSLIGFSAGGRGVREAIVQLAEAEGELRLETVGLTEVLMADALYGEAWLDDTWELVHALPGFGELTLLLVAGGLPGDGAGSTNRAHALSFLRRHFGDQPAPRRGAGEHVVERVRVVFLDASHHAIGDAAVAQLLTGPV